jgi:hypothetical protein
LVYTIVGGQTNHDPFKGKCIYQLCKSNNLFGTNHEAALVVWIKMTRKSSGSYAFEGF